MSMDFCSLNLPSDQLSRSTHSNQTRDKRRKKRRRTEQCDTMEMIESYFSLIVDTNKYHGDVASCQAANASGVYFLMETVMKGIESKAKDE
jgi:hypothetical protein